MTKVLETLTSEGYQAKGETINNISLNSFSEFLPDAVIIGGGVDDDSRSELRKQFKLIKPNIIVLEIHPQFVLEHLKRVFAD